MAQLIIFPVQGGEPGEVFAEVVPAFNRQIGCLLYTSDAADERSSVDLGGRRIIKKKKNSTMTSRPIHKRSQQNENIMQCR